MAPESILERKYSIASDVWSFGVFSWEVLSMGTPPFKGISAEGAVSAVMQGHRLDRPELCPEDMFAHSFLFLLFEF